MIIRLGNQVVVGAAEHRSQRAIGARWTALWSCARRPKRRPPPRRVPAKLRRSDVDRDEVFLVTKDEEDDDAYEAAAPQLDELVDRVDLMLIHRPPPSDMKVAKAKGRLHGKQRKVNRRQEAHLVSLVHSGEYSTLEVAELFGVGRSTVYRASNGNASKREPALRRRHRGADTGPRRRGGVDECRGSVGGQCLA